MSRLCLEEGSDGGRGVPLCDIDSPSACRNCLSRSVRYGQTTAQEPYVAHHSFYFGQSKLEEIIIIINNVLLYYNCIIINNQ